MEPSLNLTATPKRPSEPVIFDLANALSRAALETLLASGEVCEVADQYESELQELFAIDNPSLAGTPGFSEAFSKYRAALSKEGTLREQGKWIYFPWIHTLVHALEAESFQRVRTARNRNLITREEQEKFYDATVGIAGLSVGNSVALAIALQGGAERMKLADHDTLELSNLNRVRAGIDSLGLPKVEVTARQIYLLNPYAKLEIFSDGLTEGNIASFAEGCDVIVDEFDHFPLKRLLRDEAKKRGIPVVMAADNGDAGVVDIERYDLARETVPFHGRVGASFEELSKLDKRGIGRAIAEMIGIENHSKRMLASLDELGKTLVSWPQLGGTALLNGAAVAYSVRKILTGQALIDNRAILSLEESLSPSAPRTGEE